MSNIKQRLARATATLSKYYGLPTLDSLTDDQASQALTSHGQELGNDIATKKAIASLTGQKGNSAVAGSSSNFIFSNKAVATILSTFLDATSGAKTSNTLVKTFNEIVRNDPDAQRIINGILRIYAADEILEGADREEYASVLEMLGYPTGQDAVINSNWSSPSKTNPNLSIILSNSNRISLAQKDINPAVIFLNGIPNLELARAVPFLNLEFFFNRPAIDPSSKKIQTPSIYRFLLGEEVVDDTSLLSNLVSAGQISSTGDNQGQQESQNRATAGMEMFTSPQLMVNADEQDSPELRPTNVLDKFAPFLTLQGFDVTIRPTVGLFSFKEAKLNMILHDRSRLSEISDFIRPDLRAKTDIHIEYGWSHPDGNDLTADNAYGDLINGMRVKEVYGISNSSFTFNENGQVSISLELFTKGATAFDTELISSDSTNLGNVIKEIEQLQKKVKEYENRLFSNVEASKIKEIRGHQILEAAQDAFKFAAVGSKLKKSIKEFGKQLDKDNPDAKELLKALQNLLGADPSTHRPSGRSGRPAQGKIEEIRRSVQESIKRKVQNLKTGKPDAFLTEQSRGNKKGRNVKRITKWKRSRASKELEASLNKVVQHAGVQTGGVVSLGKLILTFLGEPLANTSQFDDVQIIFYPFNKFAGKASELNIANFTVDLEYFVEKYYQYRLDNMSKSGNMTIRQFLNFLADTVIDDPAADSYGLKGLFKEVFDKDGNKFVTERTEKSLVDHQNRIRETLNGVTPDGSFKMPQVEFFLEALPEDTIKEDGNDSTKSNGRTVLRVHVFDRQASAYDTVQSLMLSTFDSTLEQIGQATSKRKSGGEGNPDVQRENEIISSLILQEAASLSPPLLERKKNKQGDPVEPPMYRIVGGVRQIKDFIMRHTPYIIFGTGGTTVKSANVSTLQNAQLNAVNILRSFNKTELDPNNEGPESLPTRIIPSKMSLSSFGCPLINFAQIFFVDFQSGTTADNFYTVTGLTHKFSPGEFTTDVEFGPYDAWGRYFNLLDQVQLAANTLEDIEQRKDLGKDTVEPPEI